MYIIYILKNSIRQKCNILVLILAYYDTTWTLTNTFTHVCKCPYFLVSAELSACDKYIIYNTDLTQWTSIVCGHPCSITSSPSTWAFSVRCRGWRTRLVEAASCIASGTRMLASTQTRPSYKSREVGDQYRRNKDQWKREINWYQGFKLARGELWKMKWWRGQW